jgi:CO/xanthine dehydrogenase Mo-binding subunit
MAGSVTRDQIGDHLLTPQFAAAIANAVYHVTGIRVRDLPITLDKPL